MSVKITGRYLGDKRVEASHQLSGATLITDAPLDNHGLARSFSPTDLFATSLGVCVLTVMSIYAEQHKIVLDGSHFESVKEMSANPRRIGSVSTTYHLPSSIQLEDRKKLESVAKTCPVHRSLHPDIKAEMTFVYDV